MWVAARSGITVWCCCANQICMLQSFKKFLWAGLLLLGLQLAPAYSLLGPIGNGGDAWQTPLIGYGLTGDIGAPKNIGEEYRLNVPYIYYASDAAFLGYFGVVGSTNLDGAFAILNNLTNVSSYSADLSEFPLESEQVNYTAQALSLTDLKSTTLGLLIEHSGLASPERYVYTLHNRDSGGTPTNYTVVLRNFDVGNSPLTNVQYSAYVNGSLYSYQIYDYAATHNGANAVGGWAAISFPYLVDPLASALTPVASWSGWDVFVGGSFTYYPGLDLGGFYTGLTRDDVGGLRYLLSSNNLNTEATSVYGGSLITTNVQAQQLLTTLPFSLLLSDAATNTPSALKAKYPDITFLSVTTNFVNQITTNATAYFTNLSGPYTNNSILPLVNGATVYPSNGIVPFTNWAPVQYGDYPNYPFLLTTRPLGQLLRLAPFLDPTTLQTIFPGLLLGPVVTNGLSVLISTNVFPYYTNQAVLPVLSGYPIAGLTNGLYFTNQPGPTVLNFNTNDPFQQVSISTYDLGVFSDQAATNDPATLLALYPGLQILHTNFTRSSGPITNISYIYYLTNIQWYSPVYAVKAPVSTNYPYVTNWSYVFGNIYTNHFYTNRPVYVENIWTTNYQWYAPFFTITSPTQYYTNKVSGDFFIIPTNWCGFDVVTVQKLPVPPYVYSATNTIVYTGITTNGIATNSANAYGFTQNTYSAYTNYNYVVAPGICQPVLAIGTNYSTNIVTTYQYDFLNIVTNHYFSNSLVTLLITNIFALTNGSPGVFGTNITQTTFYTNLPSGDFYIVPNTWCGYQILPLLTNYIVPTNIVLTNQTFGSGTITNLQYTFVEYLSYTNYTYSIRPGFCEPALNFTTNYSTNIATQYQYYFGNIVTNHYYTNSPVTVITSNLLVWTNGLVGTLTNIATTTNYVNGGIGGDFFIPSSSWCSYSILATQATAVVYSTNAFAATNLPGVADLGQSYRQLSISSYTNTTFVVQPATCGTTTSSPALRQGIERVQYIRANYDSLLGQTFVPITNNYTMVRVANGQPVTEFYQRIVSAPDIVFSAADLNAGPASGSPYAQVLVRKSNIFDTSTVLTSPGGGSLAGPGVIDPKTFVTFNKAGPSYRNRYPFFLDAGTASQIGVLWGSFDGTTNPPVVYPNGTSIADLEAMVLVQVTPSSPLAAAVGVSTNITFSVTGGQSPYVWSAPGIATNVPGMTFTGSTLSGTPAAAGTFSFTLQLTDALNRVVSLLYTLTVQ